jgi:D-alanyl-D-alanine carboxypeptidase/D-alanyl-D-alanine-endopeptidase (penicillin-binding protein 4)
MIIRLLFFGIFLVSGVSSFSQNIVAAELSRLKNDPALTHAAWSFLAIYGDTKDTIARHNERMALTPASVMKLVTTGAALQILGPDYRFRTRFYMHGKLSPDGLLNGDLIIRGGGDPTLGSDKWKETSRDSLYAAVFRFLSAKGIRSVKGNILADASVFEELMAPPGWNWGDIGNYYGAGPSGLSICDNLVIYCFRSGKYGEPTEIFRTIPELKSVQFRNLVSAGGSGDNAYVFGAEYGALRYIRGTIPAYSDSFCVRGNMHDPPLFAGLLIKQALAERGIAISGEVITNREMKNTPAYSAADVVELGFVESPPLSAIIEVVNQSSNNLYAEHIHKRLSAKAGVEGSNSESNRILSRFWAERGLDPNGMFITDGSGLSRSNAMNAENLVRMLQVISADKTAEAFKKSLPVAGKSGTLRNMCKGTEAEGNLMAKSGTMNRVKAYSGYVKAGNGRPVMFAMTFTNFSCSNAELVKKIENLMAKMAEVR